MGKHYRLLVEIQLPVKWSKIKMKIIFVVLITTHLTSVYACSFCSMLATRPLVSTAARSGLLKYNLLSKVLSPKTGVGICLRNRRKAPSPIMAITTSTTATVMPADPLDFGSMTWAAEAKRKQVLVKFETLNIQHTVYVGWNNLPTAGGFSVGGITEKKRINSQCRW